MGQTYARLSGEVVDVVGTNKAAYLFLRFLIEGLPLENVRITETLIPLVGITI